MEKGSHFWQIKVKNVSDKNNLLVGIAHKGMKESENPLDSKKFWGIEPLKKLLFCSD